MINLFKKESHYAWAMFLLVCSHVVYMTYFFPRSWADAATSLEIVDKVASIIPAIRNIQHHAPHDMNYWCIFYATFWLMAPIYGVLGYIGTFYLSPYRHKILIEKASVGRVWRMLLLFLALSAFMISFPMLSFGVFLNQMSDFLPIRIASWFSTGGVIYVLARAIGVLMLKSKLNRNVTI